MTTHIKITGHWSKENTVCYVKLSRPQNQLTNQPFSCNESADSADLEHNIVNNKLDLSIRSDYVAYR